MVNNQCYVCNNNVTFETNSNIRDKYYNIIGNKLYPGSHLCYICTHMTQKLWSFRNMCLNRGVDVQYGCEEELNWSLLFRLTKDGEKPHNLEISNVHLTILCPELKCQANESTPINIESIDHDIIQELCISEDTDTGQNVHDNYFNDFDNYVINSTINESVDDRNNSLDSCFEGLNKDDYFLEVSNIQKVDFNNSNDFCGYNGNANFNHTYTNNEYTNNSEEISRDDLNEGFRGSNDSALQNKVNPMENNISLLNHDDARIKISEPTEIKISEQTGTETSEPTKTVNSEPTETEISEPAETENSEPTETEISELTVTEISETTATEISEQTAIENSEQTENEIKNESESITTHTYTKVTLSTEEQKAILENLRKKSKYLKAEFKCFNCALTFSFKDSYQSHMVRHEESNGQFSCGICGLRFATRDARRMHLPLHRERYVCSLCSDVIVPGHRKRHMVECWKVKIDPVTCHLCGKMYQDSNGLQQHLKRFHQTKEKKRNYICDTCGKNYKDQSALRTHLIKHTNRQYVCPKCPSTFTNPYNLQRHVRSHDFTCQQYCADCDKWYKSRKLLVQHYRVSQRHQQITFECPICNRVCPTRQSLEKHLQGAHSTEKPYICTICPARYSTRNSLVRHKKIHEQYIQAKEFICHFCGKSYRGKSKLTRHLREVCERTKLEEFGNLTA